VQTTTDDFVLPRWVLQTFQKGTSGKKELNEEETMKNQQVIVLFCLAYYTAIVLGCGTATHRIKIIVVDSEDNRSISSVDATLFDNKQTPVSSLKETVNGIYQGKFAPGQYMLVLKKRIRLEEFIKLKVFQGLYNDEASKKQLEKKLEYSFFEKREIQINLQDKDYVDNSVSLNLQSAVAGHLIDNSNKGINQAIITIEGTITHTMRKAESDSKGVFVIVPLEPGKYRMSVDHPDYVIDQSLPPLVDLTKGKLLTMELKMEPITDPAGIPSSKQRIEKKLNFKEPPQPQ
jgi:hypothetical protein